MDSPALAGLAFSCILGPADLCRQPSEGSAIRKLNLEKEQSNWAGANRKRLSTAGHSRGGEALSLLVSGVGGHVESEARAKVWSPLGSKGI